MVQASRLLYRCVCTTWIPLQWNPSLIIICGRLHFMIQLDSNSSEQRQASTYFNNWLEPEAIHYREPGR